MSLEDIVAELKASVGSAQMTATQALDALLAEVNNPTRSAPVPAPAHVVLRRQSGTDQIEIRVDANGGDFLSAVTLARALADAAAPATPASPLGQ